MSVHTLYGSSFIAIHRLQGFCNRVRAMAAFSIDEELGVLKMHHVGLSKFYLKQKLQPNIETKLSENYVSLKNIRKLLKTKELITK